MVNEDIYLISIVVVAAVSVILRCYKLKPYKRLLINSILSTCFGIMLITSFIITRPSSNNFFTISSALVMYTLWVLSYWVRFIFAYVNSVVEQIHAEKRLFEIALREQLKKLQMEEK